MGQEDSPAYSRPRYWPPPLATHRTPSPSPTGAWLTFLPLLHALPARRARHSRRARCALGFDRAGVSRVGTHRTEPPPARLPVHREPHYQAPRLRTRSRRPSGAEDGGRRRGHGRE